MSDYRFDLTAPLRAHERGHMGSGDHPLSHGGLAMALGFRPKRQEGPKMEPMGAGNRSAAVIRRRTMVKR